MAQQTTPKSPIWVYFGVCDDDHSKAICKVCSEGIPRGGRTPKSFNTTNLRKHLRHHPEENKKLMIAEAAEKQRKEARSSAASTYQTTVGQCFERQKPYSTDSPRYKEITNAIAQMIAFDFQPFSVVEDEGFKRLLQVLDPRYQIPSRKHFSETVIPKMYEEMKAKVKACIDPIPFIVFTTDCWTSRAVDSYISLTAHYIDEKFNRHLLVLDTLLVSERHTAQNLLSKILAMLEAWEINQKRVTCFVRDNAANITAATREGGFCHIGCVDHTLQLVITDGLKDDTVSALLKSAKAIVGHFNRSTVAQHLLSGVQTQLQLPQHQLMKECTTRWNSTYYMLERLLEQRRAVTTTLPETNCSVELTMHQWTLLGHLVALLRPFEEFSREFERQDACLSLVIPAVRLLQQHVSKPLADGESQVSRKVRKQLDDSLQQRFLGVETWELHSMATLLDPRFKSKGFSTASFAETAKSLVLDRVKEMTETPEGSESSDGVAPPPHKKPRKESSLWEDFERESDSPLSTSDAEREIEQYLPLPRLPHSEDPLKFWSAHATHFPCLAPLARKVLAVPPTSADSERVFSCAGNVVKPTRCSLDPEKVRMLIFMNRNKHVM